MRRIFLRDPQTQANALLNGEVDIVETVPSSRYASRIPGRMHACGHDGHTATLLAVA